MANNQQPSPSLEGGHTVKEDKKDDKSPLLPTEDMKRLQKASARRVTVEPIMIMASVAFGVFIVVSPQYVKERLVNARNSSLLLENSENGTCDDLSDLNTSDPYFIIDQEIQADTAFWQMLIISFGFLPALFTTPLIGAWGDTVGRKIVIILPIFGFFIFATVYLFVIYFSLPLWIVVLGSFIQGVLGNYGLVIAGALAYIADVTTKKKRALRIAVVEALLVAGIGVSQVITGLLIGVAGFAAPLWMSAALSTTCILYITVPPFLIETAKTRDLQDLDRYTQVETTVGILYSLFHTNENCRRVKLVLPLLAVFLSEMVTYGLSNVTLIYGLGSPFCWSSYIVGVYSGVVFTSGALGKTFISNLNLAKAK